MMNETIVTLITLSPLFNFSKYNVNTYYLPLIRFLLLHRCPPVIASKRKQKQALMEVGTITSATSSTLIGYAARKGRNMNRRINDGVIKFGDTQKTILTVN